MMFRHIIKENGMLFLTDKKDHAHSVHLSLYVRGGPVYETSKERGISHLTEHMVFRSLNGIPQKELYAQLKQMGTMIYACTYMECICYKITVLSKYTERAFLLLNSILQEQNWSNSEIAKEKQVVIRQIREKGYPGFEEYARKLSCNCYPWNAAIMGSESSVKKISRKRLLEWQRKISSPENVCFALAGNYTDSDYQLISKHLRTHKKRSQGFDKFKYTPPFLFHRKETNDIIIDMEDYISDVSISFDVSYENKNAAVLLSIILGALGSDLSSELREEQSLVSDIDVYVEHSFSFSRLFFVFSVDTIECFICLQNFFCILTQINDTLDTDDLLFCREYWRRTNECLQDSPEELCDDAVWRTYFTGPSYDFNYNNLELQDLKDAFSRIIHSSNMCIVITNNKSILSNQKLRRLLNEFRLLLK